MFEIFQYDFMIRAFAAGLIVAVCVPVLGSFLVARRYALIADSLAHVSLAGVGAGLLLGWNPIIVAVPVAIFGSFILEFLRQKKRMSGETSLAVLMSGGLALAVVFANLAHGAQANFSSYLFGSITTTTTSDLITLGVAAAVILVIIGLDYRAFLHIAFDENGARIAGYNVTLLNYLLAAMTAAIVVLSMRIVGGLLISALLVIPVITAGRICKSFAKTIVVAIVIAALAVIIGLILAFYIGIAAGGVIVLSALAIFLFVLLFKN